MTTELREKAMAAVMAAAPRAAEDPTRPVYHFRPPAQWMNDVCAAFHHEGYYHIFYQFNPWSDECGRHNTGEGIGWGHARSTDLVQWEFLPPALLPSEETHERLTASGSASVRSDGVPMLFFTHTPIGFPENKREAWGALPADADLIVWRRVDIGLAPGKSGVPSNISARWADMFVFKHGGRVFATFKESDGLVCEAHNDQLTSWRAIGNLGGTGPHATATSIGVAGECPNLFPLQGRQVLIRSTYPISYALGAFDPDAVDFHVQSGPRVMDYAYGGKEIPNFHSRGVYGTTVFEDPAGRSILVGWLSGFKLHRGWNGCMCLPRILSVDGDRLIQTPLPELESLRAKHTHIEDLHLDDRMEQIDGAQGDTLEIVAEFVPGTADAFGLTVRCAPDGDRGLTIRYRESVLDVAGTAVPLDLGESSGRLRLHLFLDKSVMELFINDGSASVTRVCYTKEEDVDVFVFAEDGDAGVSSLDVWQIRSVW